MVLKKTGSNNYEMTTFANDLKLKTCSRIDAIQKILRKKNSFFVRF